MDPWKIRVNSMQTEVTGGTVAWNQLVPATKATETRNGVRFRNNSDGSWTLTGTPTTDNCFLNLNYIANVNMFTLNHIYYMPKGTTDSQRIGLGAVGATTYITYSIDGDRIFKAVSMGENGYARIQLQNLSGVDIGVVKIFPQVYDLTQMFGSVIADHIYALEQATPGSGVAFFKGLFPAEFYPYSAGELVSQDLEGVPMRGLPMLDADGNFYFDGDTYANDGTVIRKYGIVDLGSLSWVYDTTGPNNLFYTEGLTSLISQNGYIHTLCIKYVSTEGSSISNLRGTLDDKYMSVTSLGIRGRVVIRDDAYNDAAAFKAALDGVYLLYERATAVTEQAQPWTIPQALLDTSAPALPGRAKSSQFICFGVDLRSLVIGCYYSPSVSITSAEGISWPAGQVQQLLDFGYHDNGACWVRTAGGIYEVGSMAIFNEWRL